MLGGIFNPMNQNLWDNLSEDARITFLERNGFLIHTAVAYSSRKWNDLMWFVQEQLEKLY